jgi:hypothetical protein
MPDLLTAEWIRARQGRFSVGWSIDDAQQTGELEVGWLRYPLSSLSDSDGHYYEIAVFSLPPGASEFSALGCTCTEDAAWHFETGAPAGAPFGVVVDCGKDFDRYATTLELRPELRALVERALATPLLESGEHY